MIETLAQATHNICIRYFFIKDQVDKGELSIMDVPMHVMLKDSYRKPLQGAFFHKFRDIIMGRVSTSALLEYILSYSIKENVEKKDYIKIDSIKNGRGIEK